MDKGILNIQPKPLNLPDKSYIEVHSKSIKLKPSKIGDLKRSMIELISDDKILILPLIPPTNLSFDEDTFILTWEDLENNNIDGYNVYLKEEGGSFTKINSSLVEVLEYDLSDEEVGGYEVYVTAVKDDRESKASVILEFEIPFPIGLINNIYFSIPGESLGRIYRSTVEDFSLVVGQYFCRNSKSGPVRGISLDSINRRVYCSSGSSRPRVRRYDLDGAFGGSMLRTATPGRWNSRCKAIPEYDGVAISNTFEAVYVWSSSNSNLNYSLFSSRQGRPEWMAFDWDEDVMVVSVGNETSRMLIWDLSVSTQNNGTVLEPDFSPQHIDIDKVENKIYLRDSDAVSIRRMDYDGSNDEVIYTHDETIRDLHHSLGDPNFIYFSTETGLYKVAKDGSGTVKQLIETTDINLFDLEYIPEE